MPLLDNDRKPKHVEVISFFHYQQDFSIISSLHSRLISLAYRYTHSSQLMKYHLNLLYLLATNSKDQKETEHPQTLSYMEEV